ncbi:MAG: hypothetical protein ACM30H_10110 [Clostridia bacterium]
MAFRAAALLAFLAATLPVSAAPVLPSSAPAPAAEAIETISLKGIAAWLRQSGKEGLLGGDVADAAGIPREPAESALEVSQRGYRSAGVLRIAQVSLDAARAFVLFMVQHPGGEVAFYVSNERDGLVRAFVAIPGHGVVPVAIVEAQPAFQAELRYWEARIAGL